MLCPGQYPYMVLRAVVRCLPWYRQRHLDYCGTGGKQLRHYSRLTSLWYRTHSCGTVCPLVKPTVAAFSIGCTALAGFKPKWYKVLYRHSTSLVDTVYCTVASPTTTGWLCFRLSLPAHSNQAPKQLPIKDTTHQNR